MCNDYATYRKCLQEYIEIKEMRSLLRLFYKPSTILKLALSLSNEIYHLNCGNNGNI